VVCPLTPAVVAGTLEPLRWRIGLCWQAPRAPPQSSGMGDAIAGGGIALLLSCCWRKAKNARGPGTASPVVACCRSQRTRKPDEPLFSLLGLSCPAGGGLRSYSYSSSRRHIRLPTVERPYSLARRLGNKRQSFTQGTFSIRPTVRSSFVDPFPVRFYRRLFAGTAATSDSLNNSPLCSIARMMASSFRATATTATLRRLG